MKELDAVHRFGVHFWTQQLESKPQQTDLPWGVWLILCWYCLPSKEVLSLKAVLAKITEVSHCKGRHCSCGGVPAPWWHWAALGCMLSCLAGSCKCVRFLPDPFWYPVKDTWWMRDRALKLQIVVWSTEPRQQPSVKASCGCWQFLPLFFLSLWCRLFETVMYSSFFIQHPQSFLFFVVPYFLLSLGNLGIFYFPLA